ncbi:glycerol-3-phosphate 1-O-acyltransferase, putative [Plasmodium ovale curtisi]|uniref:Glycerol-3-phosphate 1-O-acyltransferase, putative n=1 Tax=Plasmodium ovale curtisi TaxID=864141 RepID=A0A1A8X1M9_PLAOA|nr:glycerol-3-phosphate 1-O-acyltransferase, putative [Plasmodium ovale curtisi]
MKHLRVSLLTSLYVIILEIALVRNLKNKPFYYVKNFRPCGYTYKGFPPSRHANSVFASSNLINDKEKQVSSCPFEGEAFEEAHEKAYDEAYKTACDNLELLKRENNDNVEHVNTFMGFISKYFQEIKKHKSCSAVTFLDNINKYIETFKKYRYYSFPNVHKYDVYLYDWSLSFWSQLIDKENSVFFGIQHIHNIKKWIEEGHNVIIFSNHHIEADANIIKYFFHIHNAQNISRNMIFIGGHKIRADPLSRPFSVATNLLCIFSKKYIENPPHLKEEKISFNHKSLNALKNLLSEGKQIIWLAPSGGRDRKSSDGKIKISSFDPKIIQTFHVFAKRSKRKTHFVGLALNTYNICPPPNTVDVDEIEKQRSCSYSPIGLHLGRDIFDVYPHMSENEITTNLYNYINQLYAQISP